MLGIVVRVHWVVPGVEDGYPSLTWQDLSADAAVSLQFTASPCCPQTASHSKAVCWAEIEPNLSLEFFETFIVGTILLHQMGLGWSCSALPHAPGVLVCLSSCHTNKLSSAASLCAGCSGYFDLAISVQKWYQQAWLGLLHGFAVSKGMSCPQVVTCHVMSRPPLIAAHPPDAMRPGMHKLSAKGILQQCLCCCRAQLQAVCERSCKAVSLLLSESKANMAHVEGPLGMIEI